MAKKDEASQGEQAVIDPATQKLITEAVAVAVDLAGQETDKKIILVVEDFNKGLAAAIRELLPRNEIEIIVSNLVSKEELHEALLNIAPPSAVDVFSTLEPYVAGVEEKEPIDPQYLEGLMFRSSRQKKGETKNTPFERPLRPSDVTSWVENDSTVTFATTDGQKYTVDKE